MGLSLFGGSSSCDCYRRPAYCEAPFEKVAPKTEKPPRMTLARLEVIGDLTVIEAAYKDAKNYEGYKVLVVRDFDLVSDGKYIDPHFCENTKKVVARFEPTYDGWQNAREFATIKRVKA